MAVRFSCSRQTLLLQLILLGWQAKAAEVPEGSAAEARLTHSYFSSLCGCVNAFRNDQGAVFTAEEVSAQASGAGAFLSPSYTSEAQRGEREQYAEARCMGVLGLHGGDLHPTQLGAATGPCCTSMLTSAFLAMADAQGVVKFQRSGVLLVLHLNRDSPEVRYELYWNGNAAPFDAGSGLVDGDSVYLVNVGGTSKEEQGFSALPYIHHEVSATARGQIIGGRLQIQSLYSQEKREEDFPGSMVPGQPTFRSQELPIWILGSFDKEGQSAWASYIPAVFASGLKTYLIPTGDAQCATVTRLVEDYKATGKKSPPASFLQKQEEHQLSNVTYAEVRRHEVETSNALPRTLRHIILRIHYFFTRGGYQKFFGIATSDPGCKSGGGRSNAFGGLVRCSRWLMCVSC
ncbi:CPK2 [Symbiodinium pilosum]|uniref:CPK2 protein n=1 Tax=Symbiodinium pilosum TaxID=2952 RepID=A0A812YID8_SYMPI|nr:CPK2 [Symbiodinium pilosum]